MPVTNGAPGESRTRPNIGHPVFALSRCSVQFQSMHASISQYLPSIASICERYKVRRLELFGSAARATDFRADSDADFLVEFAPDAATGLNSFFGLKLEL